MSKGWPTLCLSAALVMIRMCKYAKSPSVGQSTAERASADGRGVSAGDRQAGDPGASLPARRGAHLGTPLQVSHPVESDVHLLRQSNNTWQRRSVFHRASLACLPSILDAVQCFAWMDCSAHEYI